MHIVRRDEPSVNTVAPVILTFAREGALLRLRIHQTGGCIDRSFDAGATWEPVAVGDPDYSATLQAARAPGYRPYVVPNRVHVRPLHASPAWQQTYRASLGPEPTDAVEGRR